MSETKINIPPELASALAAIAASRIPDGGEGVDKIARMAHEAGGRNLEIEWLATGDLGKGLPEEVPLVIDRRQGGKISTLEDEIERYRIGPDRRKGTARVTTLRAFVDLVNRHKDEGSVIFARTDWPEPGLTAVIDYHTKDHAPRHGEHRIEYKFPVTKEFKAWVDRNGKTLQQEDFALFLEERAPDLVEPNDDEVKLLETLLKTRIAMPNEVFDLARGLEVRVGQTVANHTRIQSGEGQLVFTETHTNAKGEPLIVPGLFIIQVAAFVDGGPVRIPARLRYRVKGGDIVWFYQLYQWEENLRGRIKIDLESAEFDTNLPTYEGSPEARA
ncbi:MULTISPECIES: DUF2303 family protein [unclassified Chelatococcus]|uniref:DUF2303 family protein n=1 Tax=unclassified Chelatococcus TaxID=2638111 RepID=UPI001BCAD3BD|nr:MULTISPECIES: DUF2303 family protein [unclassified Chelatococcus]MBS7699195.1 DUF2303 family protein [Chelatococcus sp. YT9]MBX3554976.1 DUF2303 family protein [Chelatococcus sp.]